MRQFLLRLFFHGGFWPRTLWRFLNLLLRRKRLAIHSVSLDRAYYYASGGIVLRWEVEHAWLIRVQHPGGYYHSSDHTWFTAEADMAPIRITIYGIGQRQRYFLPVQVKPFSKRSPAQHLHTAKPKSQQIHAGPVLRPRAQAIVQGGFRLRPPVPPTSTSSTHGTT